MNKIYRLYASPQIRAAGITLGIALTAVGGAVLTMTSEEARSGWGKVSAEELWQPKHTPLFVWLGMLVFCVLHALAASAITMPPSSQRLLGPLPLDRRTRNRCALLERDRDSWIAIPILTICSWGFSSSPLLLLTLLLPSFWGMMQIGNWSSEIAQRVPASLRRGLYFALNVLFLAVAGVLTIHSARHSSAEVPLLHFIGTFLYRAEAFSAFWLVPWALAWIGVGVYFRLRLLMSEPRVAREGAVRTNFLGLEVPAHGVEAQFLVLFLGSSIFGARVFFEWLDARKEETIFLPFFTIFLGWALALLFISISRDLIRLQRALPLSNTAVLLKALKQPARALGIAFLFELWIHISMRCWFGHHFSWSSALIANLTGVGIAVHISIQAMLLGFAFEWIRQRGLLPRSRIGNLGVRILLGYAAFFWLLISLRLGSLAMERQGVSAILAGAFLSAMAFISFAVCSWLYRRLDFAPTAETLAPAAAGLPSLLAVQ